MDEPLITVQVSCFGGFEARLVISPSASVKLLRQAVAKAANRPISTIRLVYLTQLLSSSDSTLAEHGILHGSILHLVTSSPLPSPPLPHYDGHPSNNAKRILQEVMDESRNETVELLDFSMVCPLRSGEEALEPYFSLQHARELAKQSTPVLTHWTEAFEAQRVAGSQPGMRIKHWWLKLLYKPPQPLSPVPLFFHVEFPETVLPLLPTNYYLSAYNPYYCSILGVRSRFAWCRV